MGEGWGWGGRWKKFKGCVGQELWEVLRGLGDVREGALDGAEVVLERGEGRLQGERVLLEDVRGDGRVSTLEAGVDPGLQVLDRSLDIG